MRESFRLTLRALVRGHVLTLLLASAALIHALFPAIVRGDSRIGYECTNHYFYVPRDVCEKIALCRMIADEKDSN